MLFSPTANECQDASRTVFPDLAAHLILDGGRYVLFFEMASKFAVPWAQSA